jgi:hypothetical protein
LYACLQYTYLGIYASLTFVDFAFGGGCMVLSTILLSQGNFKGLLKFHGINNNNNNNNNYNTIIVQAARFFHCVKGIFSKYQKY